MSMLGRVDPVAVLRAYVKRADGRREVHYSYERVSILDLRRWLKLRAHLAFMRAEDRANGWAR